MGKRTDVPTKMCCIICETVATARTLFGDLLLSPLELTGCHPAVRSAQYLSLAIARLYLLAVRKVYKSPEYSGSAMTSVAIVKGTQPSKMTGRALDLIGAEKLVGPGDSVLIKPNYVAAKHPSTGVTTDSAVIEALIQFTKRVGAKDIIVGEGGSGSTERAFDVVGIRDVTARQKVKLIDLNQDPRVTVRVPQPLALAEVGIAETALKSTCIINVPKLKVHHMALATLSMKNLMGTILPKSIMHSQINEKIVDLASLFKEEVKLSVIDGLVGSEIDEVSGTPVKMDLIIAGQDMVAVDTVGAMVMGIDPGKAKYLRLAEERGLGVSNTEEIDIRGENIDDVKRGFRLPPTLKRLLYHAMKI